MMHATSETRLHWRSSSLIKLSEGDFVLGLNEGSWTESGTVFFPKHNAYVNFRVYQILFAQPPCSGGIYFFNESRYSLGVTPIVFLKRSLNVDFELKPTKKHVVKIS